MYPIWACCVINAFNHYFERFHSLWFCVQYDSCITKMTLQMQSCECNHVESTEIPSSEKQHKLLWKNWPLKAHYRTQRDQRPINWKEWCKQDRNRGEAREMDYSDDSDRETLRTILEIGCNQTMWMSEWVKNKPWQNISKVHQTAMPTHQTPADNPLWNTQRDCKQKMTEIKMMMTRKNWQTGETRKRTYEKSL